MHLYFSGSILQTVYIIVSMVFDNWHTVLQ